MTVAELKQQAKDFLLPVRDDLAIEVLIAFVLKKDKSYLFVYPETEVDGDTQNQLFYFLEKLRNGYPLAYITQSREFFGLNFFVNEHVLIPRPESEFIVEYVLEWSKTRSLDEVSILDIGTGSGNILMSILKNLPQARGVGVEISEKALEVAFINQKNLQLEKRLKLQQGDLLADMAIPVDIIVANLPYIGTERFNFVSKNTFDFEPHVALFGGDDGLQLYRKMFVQLLEKSWKPQLMLGEFGFGQSETLHGVIQEYFPGIHYKIIPDYAGIDRVFVIEF